MCHLNQQTFQQQRILPGNHSEFWIISSSKSFFISNVQVRDSNQWPIGKTGWHPRCPKTPIFLAGASLVFCLKPWCSSSSWFFNQQNPYLSCACLSLCTATASWIYPLKLWFSIVFLYVYQRGTILKHHKWLISGPLVGWKPFYKWDLSE